MTGAIAILGTNFAAATPGAPVGGALTVTCSPSSSSGSGSGPPYLCSSVTTYVSGGSGSYSYSWAVQSETSGTLTISSPTGRTTRFGFSSLAGGSGLAVARVTVTDTVTGEIGIADVAVEYLE